MPRIVIIGNSAAALAAVETIRRLDRAAPVTLVSDERVPAYSRVMLPYLVSGERADLSLRPPGYYDTIDVRARLGSRAVRIDGDTVVLDDGSTVAFDRLLIATGSRAAVPAIPAVDTPGVTPLKDMAHAVALRAALGRARSAVIIGGGLICLLVVRALVKAGVSVTIAVSSDRLLSRMLDAEGSRRVEATLADAGVRVLPRTDVTGIVARRGRLRALALSSGGEIPADVAILAKGIRSETGLAESGGIAVERGVIVDQYMRTSRPGVFAAGDCAEAPDMLVRGKKTIPATWFEAVAQGEIAGYNMLREVPRPTLGSLKMNVMETLGLPVASIGMIEPAADSPDARVITRSREGSYRKLIVARDRLVGAVLVGDVSEAGMLVALIRRRRKLSESKRLDLSRPVRVAEMALA